MMRLQFRGTIALIAVADITSEASCANATFSSVSFAIFDVNSSFNRVISRSKIAFAICSFSAIFPASLACFCSVNFCLSVNRVEYFLAGNLRKQKHKISAFFVFVMQARQQAFYKNKLIQSIKTCIKITNLSNTYSSVINLSPVTVVTAGG